MPVRYVRPFDAVPGRWADDIEESLGTRLLSIDTVVSGSNLGLAGDGFIQVGGMGDNVFGNVTVELTRPGAAPSTEVVAPSGAIDRWETDTLAGFDNAAVVEGAYFFTARQGTGHVIGISIGVR